MSMEFHKVESFQIVAGNISEVYMFVRPKKKYECPTCGNVKRKLVRCFFYEHKNVGNFLKAFENPICEDCFEFNEYGSLLNEFHETDIY